MGMLTAEDVCGTRRGYQRHRRLNEEACGPCLDAERAYSRLRYARGDRTGGRGVLCAGSCGRVLSTGSRSGPEPTCRQCRGSARNAAMVPCPVCTSLFLPVRKSNGKLTLTCSVDCGNTLHWGRPVGPSATGLSRHAKWSIKNHRRRDEVLYDDHPYTLAEIACRDLFNCGLCGKMVDMSLSGMDRWGPTIDHVVPLIVSMDDRRSNVQLAHRFCNLSKGARVPVAV